MDFPGEKDGQSLHAMPPAVQPGVGEAEPVSFVHQRQVKLELSPAREAQLFGIKEKYIRLG